MEENVPQKHVSLFDQNKDGIVYPWKSFKGFRKVGCGLLLSLVAALFINMGLSLKTIPGKFSYIQKGKYGSYTNVYDTEGRFVPSKFEEIFRKHARTNKNALTPDELMAMVKGNKDSEDYFRCYVQWTALYVLCKDENGLLHKDTIRGAYDGSLEQMAEDKPSSSKKNVAAVG